MDKGLVVLPLLVMAIASFAAADEADQEGPGRGVGRVSLLNGEVSVRRGDSGDLVAAAINAPLMGLDSIVTGQASRAEIQFDSGNLVRLGSDSEVKLSDLQFRRYQIQIGRGTIAYSIPRDYRSDVEIDTPSVAVRPLTQGLYRISVLDDGSTEITARAGEVEVSTPGGSQRLTQGRTMLVRGEPSSPEFQLVNAIGYDEWDHFNQARDRELQGSESYTHVSPDIYGAEDLDRHGRWIQDPEYGSVWTPSVAPDWAPYRDGRWAWQDYYGWTWVSADPWGWAPYHYGRWFYRNTGWCWFPGGIGVGYHHYWRPALVAFFGLGGGFGAGVSFGHVGWVPLAPYEAYHPWYGSRFYGGYRNSTLINNTTIVNNTNIYNSYRNARVVNGVTAVDYGSFGRGRVSNFASVNASQLRQATLVRGQLPVTPDRASLRWNDRSPSTNLMPRTLDRTQFRGARQVQPTERVPFAQQQQHTQQLAQHFGIRSAPLSNPQGGNGPGVAGRESYSTGVRGGGQQAQPTVPRSDRPQPSVRNGADAGWRSAGRETSSYRGAVPNSVRPGSDSGWRQFGSQGQSATRQPQTNEPSGVRESRQQTPSAGRDWSRFGEPSHQNGMNIERSDPRWDRPAAAQPQQAFRDPGGGWGRFGQQDRNVTQPSVRQNEPPRYSAPNRSYSPPQGGGSRTYSSPPAQGRSMPGPRNESRPAPASRANNGGGSHTQSRSSEGGHGSRH